MTRDQELNIQAEQYSQRERARILREEPDSPEALVIREQLAAQQKQRDAQIAEREAKEAEEQRQRDEAAKAELDRAQQNLNERGRRVNFMLLFGGANYPHLVRGPQTQQYVVSELEKLPSMGPGDVEVIIQRGIAEGKLQTDYSEANRQRFHAELESMRSQGLDIPQFFEKPAASWTDGELRQAEHLMRSVPVGEVEGISNFISQQQRKQRSHAADDRDATSPPPSFGAPGSLKYRTWRLMNRDERLAAWDDYRAGKEGYA